MGAAVSAQNMIDAARGITKTETLDPNNAFCTNVELLAVLNSELQEIDDAIQGDQDEEFQAAIAPPITLVAGQDVYPLPIDAYRIRSVDIQWAPSIVTSARRFTDAERNRFRNIAPLWTQFGRVYYRTLGSNIQFMPTPLASATALINYSPSFTPLTALSDVYDSQNGWHMAAVWGVAGYIATADNNEAIADRCFAQKEKQLTRIRSMCSARITGEPPRIQRIRTRGWEDE